jgi:hypothetical protein
VFVLVTISDNVQKIDVKENYLQISVDEEDYMLMVLSNHLDYVDYTMMNVMNSLVVVVEVHGVAVVDYLDHHLDHHHHLILMMKHSNHVHQ